MALIGGNVPVDINVRNVPVYSKSGLLIRTFRSSPSRPLVVK
jgi:hypothetical protein